MGKTVHMCIDIEGVLANARRSKKGWGYLDGLLQDDSGRSLSGKEVRNFLEDYQRTTGKPCFVGCDNQTSDGRCAGHEAEDA